MEKHFRGFTFCELKGEFSWLAQSLELDPTCIVYVSGSSKIQTLLLSNVVEIAPQGFKFCNSVEKYQILLDGNNVWILLEPLTYIGLFIASSR